MSDALIKVEDLSMGFIAKGGLKAPILRGVSLELRAGETIGIVGESGSGKSTLALALMGYLKKGLTVFDGRVIFDGQDIFALSEVERQRLRGSSIALIPQNAGQALTPTMKVGQQIDEALRLHSDLNNAQRVTKTIELLAKVRLPSPEEMADRYPHQLSGGQQQRAAVAMALAGNAKVLLLDEPTTGLDVTTQAHILEFLRYLAQEMGVAMIYVSHDLGVIARVSDRVAVMYAGQLVEEGPTRDVLRAPKHPYTRGLLASIPRLDKPGIPASMPGMPPAVGSILNGCAFAERCDHVQAECTDKVPELVTVGDGRARCIFAEQKITPRASVHRIPNVSKVPALSLNRVAIDYDKSSFLDRLLKRTKLPTTVDQVNLSLHKGETLGLVGESGSGKSTILRAVAGLMGTKAGEIKLGDDVDLSVPVSDRDRETQRRVQLIFQNADASLNPRQTIGEILSAPLRLYFGLNKKEALHRAEQMLETVRLSARYLNRFPAQLSGGERQRVGVARAFAANPDVTLCDEITSALDVSVQAAALTLLAQLQQQSGGSYIFVSHDLAVVRAVSDRVAVLYQGRICEIGSVESVYSPPYHPYTQILMGAVLEPDPDFVPKLLVDDTTEKAPPATGCPFKRRCPHHLGETCDTETPVARQLPGDLTIYCHMEFEEQQTSRLNRPQAEKVTNIQNN
ncbi:ABC transporter ATP-binding protein [Pseudovibrio sp. Tun.PSC04-5.I4]|uniref:dipeptide ABC transporter ATP-binding protein n=1 Tax=Pseudovibrio sp. Tun.PSC04-5.I4 TaxID=1798213 RepID=UPI00088160C9|nr:ABC transporter ATP-binding protein [Pseudovibrio sp. Tun.PSC04-5.I4]SDR10576.1 peptide/nickel transport system ATP-binding protein [Pseudovibrio sp. Tun.PSC04-5.I4]